MSDALPARCGPRVLFFGMQSFFSLPVLMALLNNTITVEAIILPTTSRPGEHTPPIRLLAPSTRQRKVLPLFNNAGVDATDIKQVAFSRKVPVYEITTLSHAEVQSTLAAYQPDFICVACFPFYIPRKVRQLPLLACLNVHPSMLPANRGPVPLFWALRNGEQTTGVTIHLVEKEMDRGDILAQSNIALPDGAHYQTLERNFAEIGGKLLVETMQGLMEPRIEPVLQNEQQGSYYAYPTAKDFTVHPEAWEARHLYNFVCGVHDWEYPILLYEAGRPAQILAALSYSHDNKITTLSQAANSWNGPGVPSIVRCKRGQVLVIKQNT